MKKSSSKGTRILQLVAGILFLLLLIGLICVSHALLALAQEPAEKISSGNTTQRVGVALMCNKRNWDNTAKNYGGDIKAMFSAKEIGFSSEEEFDEYCSSLE